MWAKWYLIQPILSCHVSLYKISLYKSLWLYHYSTSIASALDLKWLVIRLYPCLSMVCLGTSQDTNKTTTKFHLKKSLKLKQLKRRGKFLIVKWFWIFIFFGFFLWCFWEMTNLCSLINEQVRKQKQPLSQLLLKLQWILW